MLTLLDATGRYSLPTHWGEVTTRQRCDTDHMTTAEQRANYFAGRPIQVNTMVADTLAFMLNSPPVEGGLPYPEDLGQETYLQVETIRGLVAKQPLPKCYGEVYGHFVARLRAYKEAAYRQDVALTVAQACADYPASDTWPAVAHCLAELERLATKYAELAEPDPTEAGRKAREAGADTLDVFGHFNVAYAYSQKLGIPLDAVYQMPAETVYIMLLHDRRTAIINDNLQRQAQQSHE